MTAHALLLEKWPAGTTHAQRCGLNLPDDRFRMVMGEENWARLAPPVRRRFSRKLIGAASLVYQGEVTDIAASRIGRVVSELGRLIGAPLPLDFDTVGMAAVVTVTEDVAGCGQVWTRAYGRKRGFPQIIHSSKRFGGPTGLQEYVGCGLVMMLRMHEDRGGLVFESAGFLLHLGRRRFQLPAWLVPFRVTVRHDECGDGRFAFSLRVSNRVLGELIRQTALFDEGHVVAGETP
jgi:hypothetical protein